MKNKKTIMKKKTKNMRIQNLAKKIIVIIVMVKMVKKKNMRILLSLLLKTMNKSIKWQTKTWMQLLQIRMNIPTKNPKTQPIRMHKKR